MGVTAYLAKVLAVAPISFSVLRNRFRANLSYVPWQDCTKPGILTWRATRKGGRATHYGHKINLTTGRSSLVLDVVVETGNPADSERCLPMLERHVETYGEPPQRVAFDGGYASQANLANAKELGVEHVVFHKKSRLEPTDMTPSAWIYGQLKRFRAGIEAGISYLKRCFGLDRCHWRGWEHFQAYVHSAVFAHNLLRLVRLLPT